MSGSKLADGAALACALGAQPANPITVSANARCPRSRRKVRRLVTPVDPVMARESRPSMSKEEAGILAPPDGREGSPPHNDDAFAWYAAVA